MKKKRSSCGYLAGRAQANPTAGGRVQWCQLVETGAHAPASVKRQTGMPSRRALSARFSVMPEPGKTISP